jgi:hypothetical protein
MDDPPSPRDLGGEANAVPSQLHPEVEAFARWFADWWLRRGRQLVAERKKREQEEGRRRAA